VQGYLINIQQILPYAYIMLLMSQTLSSFCPFDLIEKDFSKVAFKHTVMYESTEDIRQKTGFKIANRSLKTKRWY